MTNTVRGNELTNAQLTTVIGNGWTRREIETYEFIPNENGVSVLTVANDRVKVYIPRDVMTAGKNIVAEKENEKRRALATKMGREIL